ncbi:MAG: tannase/feruloyl esterase family alpha/beta hydrolase [Thermomicrobiales bacterium]
MTVAPDAFLIAAQAVQATDLEQIPDAPSVVEAVTLVDASADLPAHLDVRGWTAPQIRFALKLPLPDAWTGRFLFIGCGGPCGVVYPDALDRGLRAGFASATCDAGHAATAFGSLWAWGNVDAERDWAWRSTHVASIATAEIAQRIFGQAIACRYFAGSSTGGRQAMIHAQRFPQDFDGILANSPGLNPIYMSFTWPWMGQVLFEADGTPILSADDAVLIAREVLRQGDALDGIRDGIISRPEGFVPDLSNLPLDARKREVIRKLYAGPDVQPGPRGFTGVLPGSEGLGDWQTLFAGSDLLFRIARGLVRYSVYDTPPGPSFQLASWKPEDWPHAFSHHIAETGATDPDLDAFRDKGGKLLVTQPLGDAWVDPHHAMWYADDLIERYGSAEAVAAFARLFMIPGKGHSTGFGHYGPTDDTLAGLVAWVEDGVVPERLVISYAERSDLGLPAFSRPVFPYPARAEWDGDGDWSDPGRFVPVGVV